MILDRHIQVSFSLRIDFICYSICLFLMFGLTVRNNLHLLLIFSLNPKLHLTLDGFLALIHYSLILCYLGICSFFQDFYSLKSLKIQSDLCCQCLLVGDKGNCFDVLSCLSMDFSLVTLQKNNFEVVFLFPCTLSRFA